MKRLLATGLKFARSPHALPAAAYFLANVSAALVPFLLLPMLTRAMQPAAYGAYSLFLFTVSLMFPVVTLSFSAVIQREYAVRSRQKFAQFFSTCLSIDVLVVVAMVLLCVAFAAPVQRLLHLPLKWVLLALMVALAQGTQAIMLNVSNMQKKPRVYMAWRIGFALGNGVGAYVAVMVLKGSWPQLIASQVLVAGAALALAVVMSARQGWLSRRVNQADAKAALAYSLPLVAHALTASVVLQTADRFFVSHYLGLAETGSYNVAQQVSQTMYILINSIYLVWTPWYYEQMKKNDHQSRRRIVKWTYAGFALIAALGLCATAAIWLIFPYFVGPAFQDARAIFPWLVLGFVLNGMYVLVVSGIFYSGHTLQLMLCNFVTAAVNITLNMLLVPVYGMYGAAAATVLSTFCMLVLVWITTARLHGLPWLLRTPRLPE